MTHTIPPVDWRKAVSNPRLPDGASLMVPVADLRALLGVYVAPVATPAQVQPPIEDAIAAELDAGA